MYLTRTLSSVVKLRCNNENIPWVYSLDWAPREKNDSVMMVTITLCWHDTVELQSQLKCPEPHYRHGYTAWVMWAYCRWYAMCLHHLAFTDLNWVLSVSFFERRYEGIWFKKDLVVQVGLFGQLNVLKYYFLHFQGTHV